MSFYWLYTDQHIFPTVFSLSQGQLFQFSFLYDYLCACLEALGSFAKTVERRQSMLGTAIYQLSYCDTATSPLDNHYFIIEHLKSERGQKRMLLITFFYFHLSLVLYLPLHERDGLKKAIL